MAHVIEKHRQAGERRVAVTGIGIISAAGNDLDDFWGNVYEGRSAARYIKRFDTTNLPVKCAAEIDGFKITDHLQAPKISRYDLSVQYSIAAAARAQIDASFHKTDLDPSRIGVVEGTTISAMESILKARASYGTSYRKIHPYNVVGGYFGEGSSAISLQLGFKGISMTYCSGCASGADAIGHGFRIIKDDEADMIFAGGSEALMELMFGGFCKLGAMSQIQSEPSTVMRPFDATRDGFLAGEGAAFLVLEELAHARQRGVRIYGELLGHGRTCEAYHSTDPHPDGLGYQSAMLRSLRQADLCPEQVEYVNAHGSATPLNDPVESRAIQKVFGTHANKLSVSASKPIFGHLMGASGAIEAAVTLLALHHQAVPPTINLHEQDDACQLDCVPLRGRPYPLSISMSLNAGFGGRYSSLVFGRPT